MKNGVFIYQAPTSLGRNSKVGAMSLSGFPFSLGKRESFLKKLNRELEKIEVHIVKDDSEANLEEIAKKNYDFILCTPDLQKRITSSKDLPQIFYLTSMEYHNQDVQSVVRRLQKSLD